MSATSQETTNQIALIGVTQSGKTTLAAGLAKCSDKDFAVGFADDTTREYLGGVIARIDGGDWPAGTGGENIDLAITLNLKGGRSTAVAFKEYKGEKFSDPTYVQKIVGVPNGALILLNPGMEILQSASGRSKMLVNMKRIIDHLKSISCTAVALVVTAHDRLSTDLAEFKPQFDEYLSEVENYLFTKKILWKRFEVTITGPLADQKAPVFAKGAENTARAPFVWLMDRIEANRRHTKLMKLLKGCALVAAMLVVITLLGFGWKFWQEGKMLDAQESKASSYIKDFDVKSEADMKKATDNLWGVIASLKDIRYWVHVIDSRRERFVEDMQLKYDDLRYRYLQTKIENCDAKEEGLTEAKCKDVDNLIEGFNPANTSRKSALTNSWATVRPNVRSRYDIRYEQDLNRKVKDAKTEVELSKISEKIKEWEPSTDFVSEKSKLLLEVDVKTDELNGQKHVGELRDIDSVKVHDRKQISDLEDRIKCWDPRTDCGKTIKKGLIAAFNDRSKVWYQEIMDRECNEAADSVCKELGMVELIDSNSIAIRKALENAANVVHGHTNATRTVWQNATNRIFRAQDSFLARFGKERYTNKWTPEAKKRPALSSEDEVFIADSLDVADDNRPGQKLSVVFLNELQGTLKKADEIWLKHQKEICERFIKECAGMSGPKFFNEYKINYELRLKLADNPYVAIVDTNVEKVVCEYIEKYIGVVKTDFVENGIAFKSEDEHKRALNQFQDFKELCLSLAKDCCGLTNSWCTVFARRCSDGEHINKDGINQSFQCYLEVTSIEVSVCEDRAYKDYLGAKFTMTLSRDEWKNGQLVEKCNVPLKRIEDYNGYDTSVKAKLKTVWSGLARVPLNPWTPTYFFLHSALDVDWDVDDAENKTWRRISRPNGAEYLEFSQKCWWEGKHSYTVTCRIYCTVQGEDLFEVFESCRNSGAK